MSSVKLPPWFFLLATVEVRAFSGSEGQGSCTYAEDTDVGNASSVISRSLGNFTREECCSLCRSERACAVAALLPASYGALQGCWLKNGQGAAAAKKGVTSCHSGRPPAPPREMVDLELLSPAKWPAARCMDGSPGGFYHAANLTSTSWLIELEGGGECTTKRYMYMYMYM